MKTLSNGFRTPMQSKLFKLHMRSIRAAQSPPKDREPRRRYAGNETVAKSGEANLGHVSFDWQFPRAKKVFIVGTFNKWNPSATPLRNCGDDRWLLDLELEAGRYEYRFVVDGDWVDDPAAESSALNSTSGQNSILIVNV